MQAKHTILRVEDWGDKWQVVYQVEHTPTEPQEKMSTTEHGHCFPKEIFEWRAAEYGIDPKDMDTLVDVVLSEPFLTAEDFQPGENLYDAPTVTAAREAHTARCARGKLRARLVSRGKIAHAGGVLHTLRTESPMDEGVLAVKRQYVQEQRAARQREQRHVLRGFAALPAPVDRVAQIREELYGEPRRDDRG